MAREQTFVDDVTVVTAEFLNDRQDVESGLALGLRIVQTSDTEITCPVADDGSSSGATSAIINGAPRVITTPVTLTLSGAQGTYSIYATISGSSITNGFTLQAVAWTEGDPYGGTPPAEPGNSRKVGEVDWDGAAIAATRNTMDAVPGHGAQHLAGGLDPITGLTSENLSPDAGIQPGQLENGANQADGFALIGPGAGSLNLSGYTIGATRTPNPNRPTWVFLNFSETSGSANAYVALTIIDQVGDTYELAEITLVAYEQKFASVPVPANWSYQLAIVEGSVGLSPSPVLEMTF